MKIVEHVRLSHLQIVLKYHEQGSSYTSCTIVRVI